ncbi:MAG: O-methyltransferase [Opitutales bacterium]
MQEFTLNSIGGVFSTAVSFIESLLGRDRWELILRIEDSSRSWVARGVGSEHNYGRLPEEHEIRPWAVPRTTGILLHSLIRLFNCQSGLEIGTSLGYSTIFLGAAFEANSGTLTTCEIFELKAKEARKNLAKAGLENVTLVQAEALDVTKDCSQELDFVFFDADPQNYKAYLKALEPRLKPGALLVMDNALDHNFLTQPFIDHVLNSQHWCGHVVPLDHGILLARRK